MSVYLIYLPRMSPSSFSGLTGEIWASSSIRDTSPGGIPSSKFPSASPVPLGTSGKQEVIRNMVRSGGVVGSIFSDASGNPDLISRMCVNWFFPYLAGFGLPIEY